MIPFRRTKLPPLSGGMRYTADRLSLNSNEALRIINCHLNNRGIAYTRKGSRLLNTTALSGKVTSIFEYVRPSGDGVIRTPMISAGLSWYTWDSSNGFTSIATLQSSDKPSVLTFLDGSGATVCILANGTDFIKYDGSTGASSNVLSDAADFPSSQVPKFLTVYDNRLIASGGDIYPRRAYASDPLDPTTWGANSYFQFEEDTDMERISGLSSVSNMLVVTKKNKVYITTEGDPTSETVEQIPVATSYGCTSHWGIQVVGNNIYMVNNNGVFVGQLRAAIENGLEMIPIGEGIDSYWEDLDTYEEIDSYYNPITKEIIWGTKGKAKVRNDKAFVFSVENSAIAKPVEGGRFVWAGIWEGLGFEPFTFGLVSTSSGVLRCWRGDEDGYVYVMEETNQYKDELRESGQTVNKDIATTIHLAPVGPGGMSTSKRFLDGYPMVYQNINGSTEISWILDFRYETSSTSPAWQGNVPLWNDGTDSTLTEEWDTTIWIEKPMFAFPVNIRKIGSFIELCVYNSGVNTKDEISYGGLELEYQVLGSNRR